MRSKYIRPLALLLCGCGSAPAQPVSAAAPPTHEADAAVSPEIIEDEPEVYDSARDFLRSLYDECGNFYFTRWSRCPRLR